MPTPAISVLMPAYNAQAYAGMAIESILSQTFSDFELILVNDGSKDNTLEVLKRYAAADPRIRLVDQHNMGLVRTLNRVLPLARADLIARMDADDISLPTRFEEQFRFLESHQEVVCVSGMYEYMDQAERKLTTIRMPLEDQEIQMNCLEGAPALCHGCAMMRRWALLKAGGYAEGMEPAEDLDLWLRLGEVGRLANIGETFLRVRLHPSSICGTQRSRQNEKVRLACENAYRRRGVARRFVETEPWRPGDDRDSQHKFLLRCGWWAFNSGESRTAALYGAKAVAAKPLSSEGWRLLACAAVKKGRARQ